MSERKWTVLDLSPEESAAYDRLIAAAPELYEALAKALDYILAEAAARNYNPPADTRLIADIESALATANRGEG